MQLRRFRAPDLGWHITCANWGVVGKNAVIFRRVRVGFDVGYFAELQRNVRNNENFTNNITEE